MTVHIHVVEHKWYIAVQDGRLDNREFDTYEEATAARKQLSKSIRMGTCIVGYTRPFEGKR